LLTDDAGDGDESVTLVEVDELDALGVAAGFTDESATVWLVSVALPALVWIAEVLLASPIARLVETAAG
jgi:hypothetical protein